MKESSLRQGEKILYVVRHHGLYLFGPIVLTVLPAAAGLILPPVTGWAWLSYLLWLSIPGALWLLYRLLILRTDIWTITDRRLVDETGILARKVKESPFEKIHNAQYDQSILGRIFNFGNMQVQTASEHGASSLKMVRDPAQVKSVLMQAVDADLENKQAPAL